MSDTVNMPQRQTFRVNVETLKGTARSQTQKRLRGKENEQCTVLVLVCLLYANRPSLSPPLMSF